MNVLMIGDVVGRPGREAVRKLLPGLRARYDLDFVVANVENAAAGFGVTPNVGEELLGHGIDVMTSGNHIYDKKEVLNYIPNEPRLLRPLNYAPGTPGAGVWIGKDKRGVDVAVINVQGRVFMPPTDCPFRAADRVIEELRNKVQVILVDHHAEATSEKVAMGWYLDGRVAAVVGTHTHVQTADECILPQGTAYITDLGMSGPYDGVIGVEKAMIIGRFLRGMPQRFETAKGDARLCGMVISIDPSTGKAQRTNRLMMNVE